jgi:hypothetical protein
VLHKELYPKVHVDGFVKKGKSAYKKSSIIKIRNGKASAHSPMKIHEPTRRLYDK